MAAGRRTALLLIGKSKSCIRTSSVAKNMKNNDYFIDFDANLFHSDMVGNCQRLVTEANAQNIRVFVVPGSTLADSSDSLRLSSENQYIMSTCGVHPYHSQTETLSSHTIESLNSMVINPSCLAIGECGLDYSDGFPDKSFQIEWFEKQIEFALGLKKPLYLHERQAHNDFINILAKYGFNAESKPPVPAVIHCFTGSIDELKVYLSLGFYIGLTGYIINNLTNEQAREILELITLDRLMIETDAPYMGFKGCRIHDSTADKKKKNQKYPNVPSALILIAQHISTVTGWSMELIANRTTSNVYEFFDVGHREFK